MFRGKTARTVVMLLTAVLFALQFFASTESFAPAHTARHAEAKAQPGLKLSGKALRAETITFRDCGADGTPTVPLRLRDRYRSADCGPETPERPLLTEDPAAVRTSAAPGAASHIEILDSTHSGGTSGLPLLRAGQAVNSPTHTVMQARRAQGARQEEPTRHAAPHRLRPYVRTTP